MDSKLKLSLFNNKNQILQNQVMKILKKMVTFKIYTDFFL